MKKVTTKMHILQYLGPRGFVSGSELESMSGEWYTKSSVISRRCRELAADGYLERSLSKHGAVQYRIPVVEKKTYSDVKAAGWL